MVFLVSAIFTSKLFFPFRVCNSSCSSFGVIIIYYKFNSQKLRPFAIVPFTKVLKAIEILSVVAFSFGSTLCSNHDGNNTSILFSTETNQEREFQILYSGDENKYISLLGSRKLILSIILSLKKMGVSRIILSNRTKKKAEDLKKIYQDIEVVDWGEFADFNIIINFAF